MVVGASVSFVVGADVGELVPLIVGERVGASVPSMVGETVGVLPIVGARVVEFSEGDMVGEDVDSTGARNRKGID